jgi:hypothetical protein
VVEQEPKPQIERPISTMVPQAIESPHMEPEMELEAQMKDEVAHSLFSFIVLIVLMWAVSSAYLADKRPAAIRAIEKTISSPKYKGE